ncbi:MAG: hydroxyacid dehydrogenase [Treponemataceae bacterium]
MTKIQTGVKKWKALLPQPIEKEAVALLEKAGFEIVLAPECKPEVVGPLMKGVHVVILRTGIKVTGDLLKDADELLMISRTGAGVDNVDLKAATERGILVTSSLGANTTSVSEHCLALLLALSKQLFLMDREVRGGNFAIRYKNLPRDLRGKTLGVLGFGRIGSLTAKACRDVFDMKILANDDFLPDDAKKSLSSWVEFRDLDTLFSQADAITIHIPFVPEAAGLVGKRLLGKMKKTAFIINTSRGGIIDEAALAEALETGNIAGAGLDVFEDEPPKRDNPLLKLPNVILTPHSAALTEECVLRMAVAGAERAVELSEGNLPANIANPDVLKHPRWAVALTEK